MSPLFCIGAKGNMRLKQDEYLQGQYYHICNQAVAGQLLFRDRSDYEMATKLMTRYYSKAEFGLVSYCLMPTCFQILLYQKTKIPAYTFIYKWSHAYSKYFNTKHMTMGTIFSDNLQSICIQDDKTVLRLCADIHLEPFKAKLITDLADWEWSNYPEWTGQRSDELFDSHIRDLLKAGNQKYSGFVSSLKLEPKDSRCCT